MFRRREVGSLLGPGGGHGRGERGHQPTQLSSRLKATNGSAIAATSSTAACATKPSVGRG
jgi:hypothetical protein